MASQVPACVLVISFIIANVAPGSTRRNFPLEDCKNHDVDMLVLLDYDIDQTWRRHKTWIEYLTTELSNLTNRWKSATVLDHFTAYNVTTNVSSWSFRPLNHTSELYVVSDLVTNKPRAKHIDTVLELKIRFVKKLFSKVNGVRSTAIHTGVIFLGGINFTMEDIKQVPTVVHEINTDVKIFVVIFGNKHVQDLVRFDDTIVLPYVQITNFQHHLLLTMCKRCTNDWDLFEHTTGMSWASCYHAEIIPTGGWLSARSYCRKDHFATLVGIDTIDESDFLTGYLLGIMIRNDNHTILVNIGLHRDTGNYAKRYHWVTISTHDTGPQPCNSEETKEEEIRGRTISTGYRPLLMRRWLKGRRHIRDCGSWNLTRLLNNRHEKKIFSTDGWRGVQCSSQQTSYALCEVSIPQMVNVTNLMSITQTQLNSFMPKLESGNFIIYKRNIVSISENVANTGFLQFLKDSNIDFPVFDCGKGAGYPRYISYSKVCDFVDHCRNARDETSCFNPLSEFAEDSTSYCSSGQKLHTFQGKCDNVRDCHDRSDETGCDTHSCNSFRCADGSCLPPQWINDGEIDCLVLDDDQSYNNNDENISDNNILQFYNQCALICNINECIKQAQLNDSVRNCKGPEGPLDETIGKLKPANTCKNEFQYFVWAPKCTYIKDRYGGIIGCRDMSHVKDCENYTCGQGYVKCYNSYCIPQHYLLDGKDDCPTGEDEQPLYIGPCIGNFACWDSKVCLHPDHVCDGHPDCPHHDDELDCHIRCPKNFRCVAGTMTMLKSSRPDPQDMLTLSNFYSETKYLDLSGISKLQFNDSLFDNIFRNLNVLILSKCRLNEIYLPKGKLKSVNDPPLMIQKLDISYNSLRQIFTDIRYTYYYKYINHLNVSYNRNLSSIYNLQFRYLEILDLSYTRLTKLNDLVFVDLPKLQILNLSHTLISVFNGQYFSTSFKLRMLDLRNIRTKDFNDFSFHGLTISQKLYTDYYQICCPQTQDLSIPSHACNSPQEAISSCYDLLGLDVQRVLLWILAVVAVLGNITVIIYRIIWDRSHLDTGYGLFVTHLGISDFIMGDYLFIIAAVDYYHRDKYVLYDKTWRESPVCKLAGFMATLSCEASTLFVFLITLDRYLVMKFPFGQKKWTRLIKYLSITWCWVESFVLSLLPIVLGFDIYSSNAMCLGLPLENKVKGWEYSVGVFVIHNFIMFLLIAYGQYAIFRAMSGNRVSKTVAGMSRIRQVEDIKVARQLSLVVLSNFMFWFPVGVIGLMSLGGYKVSYEAYAWITVILLPINSAVNPILYTVPAIMARWEKFKYGNQMPGSISV